MFMRRKSDKVKEENEKLRKIIKNQDTIIYNQDIIIHKLLKKQLILTMDKIRIYHDEMIKKDDFLYLDF